MEFSDPTTFSRKAAKVGGWTFLLGAALCGIGMWLAVMAYFLLRHYVIGEPASWRGNWFLPSLFEVVMFTSVGLAIGTVAFLLTSWPFGRVAGKMIACESRRFGWVGPLAMAIPTIFAAVVGTLAVNALTDGKFLGHGRQYWQSFEISVLVFMLWFLIPAMLTGLLGGLYMRQWGRKMADFVPNSVQQ